MKTIHKRLAVRVLIALLSSALTLATGCKRTLKQTLQQAQTGAAEEQRAARQAAKDATLDYLDEWPDYRSSAEAQFAANTRSIDSLMAHAAADTKRRKDFNAALENLVQKNRELKARLDSYKDQGKVDWDVFKRDFSNDLMGLDKALKGLATNGK